MEIQHFCLDKKEENLQVSDVLSVVKICSRHCFYLWFRFAFMKKHYYGCWIFFLKIQSNKA